MEYHVQGDLDVEVIRESQPRVGGIGTLLQNGNDFIKDVKKKIRRSKKDREHHRDWDDTNSQSSGDIMYGNLSYRSYKDDTTMKKCDDDNYY